MLPLALFAAPLLLFAVNGDKVKVADSRCYVEDVVARTPQDAAVISWWSLATPSCTRRRSRDGART